MDKKTFLAELKNSLGKEVNSQVIEDNIKYYSEYFESEKQNGKTEQEVSLEIGDPRLIAKTIISTESIKNNTKKNENNINYNNDSDRQGKEKEFNILKILNLDKWYRKLILLLAVVLIFIIIVNLVSWLLPIVVPISLIIWIVSAIGKGRK